MIYGCVQCTWWVEQALFHPSLLLDVVHEDGGPGGH